MDADAAALDPALLEREVGSFAIDSREAAPGSLFFALSQPEYRDNGFNGDFDDSTVFAASAFEAGVRPLWFAATVMTSIGSSWLNTQTALSLSMMRSRPCMRVAHGAYLEWDRPVVAVTGSAGKTTAKELMCARADRFGRRILKNIKNYNNGLGHPLTVLAWHRTKATTPRCSKWECRHR